MLALGALCLALALLLETGRQEEWGQVHVSTSTLRDARLELLKKQELDYDFVFDDPNLSKSIFYADATEASTATSFPQVVTERQIQLAQAFST